ncbi:hypothetical protein PM082_018313 [Marasmius tenuissimus]|nr:hypothetical protein PM082_018313 [Marasmius tenuissimus]
MSGPDDDFLTGMRFFQWQGWTGLLACMIAESILQMRLYALYSLNQRVLVMMVAAFLLTSAAAAAIMETVISNIFSVTAFTVPLSAGPSQFAFRST